MVDETFDKQVPKEGFQVANAKYMGYSEEPKEGEKNGKAWRKTKLRWLIDGKQNENKFILWSPITSEKSSYKDDKALKQFSMYKIVWVEEEKSYDNKEWVEKRIVVINDASEEEPNENAGNPGKTDPTQTTIKTSINVPDLSNFDEFTEKYRNLCAKKQMKPSAVHMLGSWIASKEHTRITELLDKCKEAVDGQ